MNIEEEPDIYILNPNYSTTRLLAKVKPKLVNKPKDEFESILFFSENKDRNGEGGLRTKGYFKQSLSDKPLVTIVTVVFNGEKYLEETIRSVINQSYENIEYIIIDGGSTDGTIDIIKNYEDKLDYWVSEKDEGIYHAMNKGITVANGDIIGIINSDDWLESGTIEKVAKKSLVILEEEFVVHGKVALYDADNRFVTQHYRKKIPGYYLFSSPFKHPAMFVSKKLYKRIGLYDETCGLAADYDLMLRIISYNSVSLYIDKVLTNVRLVGISTGGHVKASNKELLLILKHNTGSWILAALGLVVRALKKVFKLFK